MRNSLFVRLWCLFFPFLLLNQLLLGPQLVVITALNTDDQDEEVKPDEYITDEHWNYSTHLNEKNFHKFITDNIAVGKTIFVRWTAGLYCGSCARQAQAWDDAIRLFSKSPHNQYITFGDVNIKESGITKLKLPPHKPGGNGGWPTIRYFNQQTGLNGGDYIQKTTTLRKWEELGPDQMFLIEYIEEQSNQPLCDAIGESSNAAQMKQTTTTNDNDQHYYRNCDDQSIQFIKECSTKTPIELQTLLQTVQEMESTLRHKSSSSSSSNKKKRDIWLVKQKYILLQLIQKKIFQ